MWACWKLRPHVSITARPARRNRLFQCTGTSGHCARNNARPTAADARRCSSARALGDNNTPQAYVCAGTLAARGPTRPRPVSSGRLDHLEMIDLMEANERRLERYRRAARQWAAHWPVLRAELIDMPLGKAHARLIEVATDFLPMEVATRTVCFASSPATCRRPTAWCRSAQCAMSRRRGARATSMGAYRSRHFMAAICPSRAMCAASPRMRAASWGAWNPIEFSAAMKSRRHCALR